VLVPVGAGVASALGLHIAAPAHESVATALQPLESFDGAVAERLLAQLEQRTSAALVEAGATRPVTTIRAAELRFVGQGQGLFVQIDDDAHLSPKRLEALFRASY